MRLHGRPDRQVFGFQGETSGKLFLFLVSGSNQLDLVKAARLTGEPLKRADRRQIRDETGFAIGGLAPIGHLDETLSIAYGPPPARMALCSPPSLRAIVNAARAVIATLAS
ncbi:hypothetical protein ABID19_003667 [Mesorhizobium robiniae]|uniref:YbaK/aminoacyl-tRNA synthetase-associated domain-containing protein n=1 Tax=Mesorhizobium robiniae TaxID=559315 RepID=A0ABV2GQR3_9HYPH